MKALRNIKNLKKSGFTLVELLVVIAIIGVLSSVVIASLQNARNRASNVAVKSNLSNMRSSVEIIYDNNGQSYGTTGLALTANNCPTIPDTTLFGQQAILNSITSALNAAGAGGTATCVSTPASAPVSTWAVSVSLKTPETVGAVTNNFWCVDYLANSKGEANDLSGTDVSCP